MINIMSFVLFKSFSGGYLVENNIDGPISYIQAGGENKKFPGPVIAGIFFSLTTIFLTYGGGLIAFKNGFLRSGIGEVFFILFPVLVFLIVGRYNIKDTLKIKKTRPINYLIVVFLMMFGMPVVGVLNAIVIGIIRLIFGKNLPMEQILIPDVPTLFIAILVIGVAAAVCEETLFRGLISKGYSRFGVVPSLVMTSILFGILHRDIQKAVSTILLGALIGFIVHRTKSIYTGMVAHFTNNTVAVLLAFGTTRLSEKLKTMGISQAESLDFSKIPTASLVIAIIFYAIIFLAFVAGFVALIYAFYRSTEKGIRLEAVRIQLESEATNGIALAVDDSSNSRKFSVLALIAVLPGLILILLTFVGQILELMNVNSGIIYDVLKTLGLV
jgi:uncharacterized protein